MTDTNDGALLQLQVAVLLILHLHFCWKYICVFVAVFLRFHSVANFWLLYAQCIVLVERKQFHSSQHRSTNMEVMFDTNVGHYFCSLLFSPRSDALLWKVVITCLMLFYFSNKNTFLCFNSKIYVLQLWFYGCTAKCCGNISP